MLARLLTGCVDRVPARVRVDAQRIRTESLCEDSDTEDGKEVQAVKVSGAG